MDKIEQGVSDVVAIANGARDHEQAKVRIKELLDDATAQSCPFCLFFVGPALTNWRRRDASQLRFN